MAHPPSVNLHTLNKNAGTAVIALQTLAKSNCGPLRLKKKVVDGENVHYLGVRSWPTFFFENICASSKEIRLAKLKTQKAIDEHVRPFLHEITDLLAPNPEMLTYELQSKVTGKTIQPAYREDGDSQVDKVFDQESACRQ